MTSRSSRSTAFCIFRGIVIAILAVLLLPYAIAPFYRVVDPVSTLMLWRRATGARVQRTWVPLTTIAPALPRTVIAAEDARFCVHHGVDLGELRAALEAADDLAEMRGCS